MSSSSGPSIGQQATNVDRAKKKKIFKQSNETNASTGAYLIDDRTREEIRGILNAKTGKGNTATAAAMVKAAKEGIDPKYKARVATQSMYETLLDQPGQQQTRSSSLLDAYKGSI